MNVNSNTEQTQIRTFSQGILKKESDRAESTSIFAQLESAFNSVESLNTFAREDLGLTLANFDASRLSAEGLAEFKTKIMADLAHARAENHGFLKSTEGIMAWLRNAFMSFAMHVCAQFNHEKLFERNETTTNAMRSALEDMLSPNLSSSSSEANISEEGGFTIVGDDLGERQASTVENESLSSDIINRLEVMDTPRDGSCMLWSVLTGLSPSSAEAPSANPSSGIPANDPNRMAITDGQGKISDEKVLLARDVTIPELRQVISMGMLAEGKEVSETKEMEGGGFGAKHIEPEQMKYISKHLGIDIAIVTKRENQSTAYLCTKEGELMIFQLGNGNENFSKERFEAALRNGPAIFAQDGHARCLKYDANAQIAEQPA
ncbi:MAG: hypothetical protein LBC30_01430 [Puniceicoccales bacterium]|nr:hypothetical protein [Puniceicoccales bacterium]